MALASLAGIILRTLMKAVNHSLFTPMPKDLMVAVFRVKDRENMITLVALATTSVLENLAITTIAVTIL